MSAPSFAPSAPVVLTSEETAELFARAAMLENELLAFCKTAPKVDGRANATAITNIEQGFMWLRRSFTGARAPAPIAAPAAKDAKLETE